VCEYVVSIAKEEGLTPGLRDLPGGVVLHHACHARAQNVGFKVCICMCICSIMCMCVYMYMYTYVCMYVCV